MVKILIFVNYFKWTPPGSTHMCRLRFAKRTLLFHIHYNNRHQRQMAKMVFWFCTYWSINIFSNCRSNLIKSYSLSSGEGGAILRFCQNCFTYISCCLRSFLMERSGRLINVWRARRDRNDHAQNKQPKPWIGTIQDKTTAKLNCRHAC